MFAVCTCVLRVSDVFMYIWRFLLFILICSRTSEVEGKAFGAKQFLLFADSEACRIHERSADLHRTQKKVS